MKRIIVSGYFNPLRAGHLDLIEGAAELGDRLIVVVNNDKQQILRKGKIITDEKARMRIMDALGDVDETVLSIDEDLSQRKTLALIAERYPKDELVFANGGDRDTEEEIPEAKVCQTQGIRMVFNIGAPEQVVENS